MNETALYNLLKQMNIPVAYRKFVETTENPLPNPPFIQYYSDNPNNFIADDKVYVKDYKYVVDLVTELKDVTKEAALEKIFDDNYIPWQKSEEYIDSEKIFQISYFI